MSNFSIGEVENEEYYILLETAIRELFDMAKEKNELHFALALNPEFRGTQSEGWNTALEAIKAFDEYIDFLNDGDMTSVKARVALGFYTHMAEASGLYEVPKNMLLIADEEPYSLWPFQTLVDRHRITGNLISPNANKILKDLAGHAKNLELNDLALCFRDSFNSDLRNGYAHADYIIWDDGIRLRNRNGGNPKIVNWSDFQYYLARGIDFFTTIRAISLEYKKIYEPEKKIMGSLGGEPISEWTIGFNSTIGALSVSG